MCSKSGEFGGTGRGHSKRPGDDGHGSVGSGVEMPLARSRGGCPDSMDVVSGRNPGSVGEGPSLSAKAPLSGGLPQAIVSTCYL